MTANKELIKVEKEKQNEWEEALKKEAWVTPVVDIFETDDDYFLVVDIPGVSRENIKLKLENGNLVIMGRINYEKVINKTYIMQERNIGNFYREFKISDSIYHDKIEARYENGQLLVRLPKDEKIKPKNIEIK
ncbi:MAG: Hsp20/alpha crystallin family protein [Chlorobi bacterium]|nr:Hsp20/alpha crystallin family protein [Chlorobiota bacterium]